ncbi:gamma-glutamyl-phosphate reductase, partial [Bacillus sp. VT-16-64]
MTETPGGATEQASRDDVHAVAVRARSAAVELATLSRAAKDAALLGMADALDAESADILEANGLDVGQAIRSGAEGSLVARLRLDASRVAAMAQGLRDVAALPDPVGEVIRGYRQPNGLQLTQLRVPFGLLAIVYEAR